MRRIDSLSFLGFLLAIAAIFLSQVYKGGSLEGLLNLPALLIVFGGTLGAVMVQTSSRSFRDALLALRWIIQSPVVPFNQEISRLSRWNKRVRQHGLLSLENITDNVQDDFLQKGLDMLLSGCDRTSLRKILEVELDSYEMKQSQIVKFYESLAGYAPTIGILGAVLGLIKAMKNLADPTELGLGIAIAFIATVYGVALANLLFYPVANKLKSIAYDQMRLKEMYIEGLCSILEGEHPRILLSKLKGYANGVQ